MIDSDKSQQVNYKHLLDSFQYMVSLMNEGNRMNDIYDKVYDFVKSKDENLLSKLPDSFGYGVRVLFNLDWLRNKELLPDYK